MQCMQKKYALLVLFGFMQYIACCFFVALCIAFCWLSRRFMYRLLLAYIAFANLFFEFYNEAREGGSLQVGAG